MLLDKWVGPVKIMFENGTFEEKYRDIIEIRPRRAMVSDLFDAALRQLRDEGYTLIQISDNWLRAFSAPKKKRRTKYHG